MSGSAARDPDLLRDRARLTRLAAVLRAGRMPPARQLQTRAGLLQYAVSGAGPPIVLLSGAGVAMASWRRLYPAIERVGTVLAWNRFGVRSSDEPRRAQNGALVIAALRELLAYTDLQPPYILVGHSLGGLYANLFARLHPPEVAGVLFLEATHPGDHEALAGREQQLTRALAKVFALPPRLFQANLRAELQAAAVTAQEVEAAGPFPALPITVVSGGAKPPKWLVSPEAARAKRAHQEELSHLSPLGDHVIAQRSGHFPQASEPALVLEALQRLVARSTR